jgi:two-component system LytT family response regulator
MKILIVDDEVKAQSLLKKLITDLGVELEQLFTASNLLEGIDIIQKENPQIVFLDIEMPEYSGLEILDHIDLEQYPFKIIFTTAYQQYATEAFKLSAVDYLLKPIDPDELEIALNKAIKIIEQNKLASQIKSLQNALNELKVKKIALEVPHGIIFTNPDEIIYFEADGMYTNVVLKDQKKRLICKPLKHFVEQLSKNKFFFKPHRSYLINLNYMTEFIKKDGDYILLDTSVHIPISRSRKDDFTALLREIFL